MGCQISKFGTSTFQNMFEPIFIDHVEVPYLDMLHTMQQVIDHISCEMQEKLLLVESCLKWSSAGGGEEKGARVGERQMRQGANAAQGLLVENFELSSYSLTLPKTVPVIDKL